MRPPLFKRIGLLFFCCLVVTIFFGIDALGQLNVRYTVTDFQLTTGAVRRVTITPIGKGGDYTGNFLTPTPLNPNLWTNGTATFSNVVPGYAYSVAFETSYSKPLYTNYFPVGLAGYINGRDYLAWIAGFAADGSVIQWAWLYQTNLGNILNEYATTNYVTAVISTNPGGGVVSSSATIGVGTNGNIFTPHVIGTLTNNTTGFAAGLDANAPVTNLVFNGTSTRFGLGGNLPLFDASSELGWLQLQADGKFQLTLDGSSLTNLTIPVRGLVAGTNIILLTNGSLVTIHGTATSAGGGTFNVNQFGANASGTNIKSGALLTNIVVNAAGGSPHVTPTGFYEFMRLDKGLFIGDAIGTNYYNPSSGESGFISIFDAATGREFNNLSVGMYNSTNTDQAGYVVLSRVTPGGIVAATMTMQAVTNGGTTLATLEAGPGLDGAWLGLVDPQRAIEMGTRSTSLTWLRLLDDVNSRLVMYVPYSNGVLYVGSNIVSSGFFVGNGSSLSNVVHTSGVNIVADGWLVGDGLQSSFESLGGGLYYAATGHVFTGVMIGNGGGLTNITGAGTTGMRTNQFTTNVFGAPIIGEVRHSSLSSWTNGAPNTGVTNNPNGNVVASGTVTANAFAGDGTLLTALPVVVAGTNGLIVVTNAGPPIRYTVHQSGDFDVMTVQNLYATNTYTLITNAPMLGTDGNSKIVAKYDGGSLTNLPAAAVVAPDTVAWAAGSLTLGWPTVYSTHSITSNSWVTGFSGGIAGKTLTCFLTITNATATDWTLSVSNSVTTVDGLRSWTVTNKQSRGFSFKVGAQTNSATGPFF